MRHLATTANGRREQGFSLFEFAVTATIVAILAALLLQRLSTYRAHAELAAIERIVAILRTALTLKTAELRGARRAPDIAALAGSNPFDLLAERPANYLGEYFAPDITKLDQGNWYFDRKAKALVYLPNKGGRFPQGTANLMFFKVELTHLPSTPAKPNTAPEPTGVTLIQVNR